MRASCGLYRALGRFFDSAGELADAACMSRNQLWLCLNGRAKFKKQQEQAICNAIIAKMVMKKISSYEMLLIIEARDNFDEIFKRERI